MYDNRPIPLDQARPAPIILLALAIVLAFLGSACGGGGGSTAPTSPSTPPPPPTGTTHSVTLSWTASTSTEVVGYLVYRRPASDENYTLLNPSPTASLQYVDLDVKGGDRLAYTVTSVDSTMQQSVPSAEVTVTIPQ